MADPTDTSASAAPAATGLDISGILSSAYSEAKQAFSQIAGSAGGGGQGLATATAATTASGQASSDIALIQNAADMKLKADNLEAASRYGMTPGAPSASVVAISSAIADQENRMLDVQKELQAETSTNFLDNPVQWLMNQIALPFTQQKASVLMSGIEQNTSVLSKLAALTDEQYKVNQGIDTSASTAKGAALSALAFAQAKERLADAQFKSAQLGIEATNIRLAATRDQWDAAVAINNAQNASTEIGIRMQGLDLQKKEYDLNTIKTQIEQDQNARQTAIFPLQQLEAQLKSTDMQEKMNAKVEYQKKLDQFSAINNMPRILVDQFQLMGDSPLKAWIGDELLNPNLQDGRYSFDAASSVQKLNARSIPLTEGAQYIRDRLTEVMQKTIETTGVQMWHSLDPTVQHMKQQNDIKSYLDSQAKIIPDQGGIFSPPPLLSTLKIPAVMATDLGKSLAPLAKDNPLYPTKAQDIFALAAQKVQSGNLTVAQAADQISQIYNSVLVDNNNERPYKRFGFDGLNNSTGFRMSVTTGSAYSSLQTIDMTNSAAVASVLTKMILQEGITRREMQNPQTTGMQ